MALGVSFLIYATPISLKAGPLLPDVSGASSGWSDATANFSIPDERRETTILLSSHFSRRQKTITFHFLLFPLFNRRAPDRLRTWANSLTL